VSQVYATSVNKNLADDHLLGSCKLADIRRCRVQFSRHMSDFCCKLPDTVGSNYPTSEIRHDYSLSLADVGCFTASFPTLSDTNNPNPPNSLQIIRHVGWNNPTSQVCRLQIIRHHVGHKKSDNSINITQLQMACRVQKIRHHHSSELNSSITLEGANGILNTSWANKSDIGRSINDRSLRLTRIFISEVFVVIQNQWCTWNCPIYSRRTSWLDIQISSPHCNLCHKIKICSL